MGHICVMIQQFGKSGWRRSCCMRGRAAAWEVKCICPNTWRTPRHQAPYSLWLLLGRHKHLYNSESINDKETILPMSSACWAFEFLGVPSSICVRGCLEHGWLKGSHVIEIPTPTQMTNPKAVTLELHPRLRSSWAGQVGKFPLSISLHCLLKLGWGGGMACKSCKFRYFLRLGSCYFLSFKEPLWVIKFQFRGKVFE